MAVTANSVITPQGVQTAQATCTAAKTTYTDNTNAVLLLTAGANGGVLYGMTARAKGTTGGGGRVDVFSSLNGTTLAFINGANFATYTQSTTAVPPLTDLGYTETAPRRLAPLEQIWVGTSIATTNGIVVDAQYENL
jgi:hypothetical protein